MNWYLTQNLDKKCLTPRHAQLGASRQQPRLVGSAAASRFALLLLAASTTWGEWQQASAAPQSQWTSIPGATRTIGATWQDQTLDVAVERLATAGRTPAWIDRRVNRQQLVSISLSETTVAGAFQQVASSSGYEATPWRGLVIVAPVGAADELATLTEIGRERLRELPVAVRNAWLQPAVSSWPRLAEPRSLLLAWLGPLGLADSTAARVPHDLLPAGKLPSLAPLDRATLVLAGFDLKLQIDSAGRPSIEPIERPVRLTRAYRLRPRTTAAFDAVLADLVQAGAAAVVNPEEPQTQPANGVLVSASVGGHEQLAAVLSPMPRTDTGSASGDSSDRGRPRRNSRRSEQRFTLKLTAQPLGAVLDQLAKQLGMQIAWNGGADPAEHRRQRVSCDVKDASVEQLLAAIAKDAGLTCEIDGQVATLSPAQR
ncbi:MAG: hypothetical protein CMJ58_04810 [Planctomycetaceae bacterium]|nr:hypothetical protein [Planctomycetaceae bacterium]